MSTPTPPMLFILDAVDEFPNKASQKRIVEAFCEAMERAPRQIPFKLFIASRPERSIQSAFTVPQIAPAVRTISLDADYLAYEDIRIFLAEGFRDLKRLHPSPDIFPPIRPTEEAINELVKRSSGQFLYAATVLNYVQEEDADPVQCLQAVLTREPDSHIPAEILKSLPGVLDHVYYVLPINSKQSAFVALALPFFILFSLN